MRHKSTILPVLGLIASHAAAGEPSRDAYSYAEFKPVPHDHVELTGGFWNTIRTRSRDIGVPALLDQFEKNGHIENFRICAEHRNEKHRGGPNCNEFFYKHLEAMAWYAPESEEVARLFSEATKTVLSAQQPDGYLNTFYENPLTKKNGGKHFAEMNRFEFYNFGHFTQAAIADYRASGSRELLDAATRFADLIVGQFADPNDLPYKLYRGRVNQKYEHPNHELALVELYRVTGNTKYLDFVRQTLTEYGYFGDEHFDRMWGHAVQENLLEAGAADLFLETGDKRVRDVVSRLWEEVTRSKMYITGGTGSRSGGESYDAPYELPNSTAYAETCAAIALTFWHHKMLLLTGNAKYADEMERTLHNGVLVGYGLDGRSYFYQNPQSWRPEKKGREGRRFRWHGCPCCPPNLHRLFAGIDQYIYTYDDIGVQVNLYADSSLEHRLPGGEILRLTQKTAYPYEGKVILTLDAPKTSAGTIKLRIPSWCDDPEITIDGKAVEAKRDKGYAVFDQPWRMGRELVLLLPMKPRVIKGNPKVEDQAGRIAIQRGPFIYCLEQADNSGVDFSKLAFSANPEITPRFEPGLLDGVVSLSLEAKSEGERDVKVKMVPYYAWANREPGEMMIWLP